MLLRKRKTIPLEKHEKLKRWYLGELKRRDDIIEDLKRTNQMLINSALKQSEKRLEIKEHARSLLDLARKKVSK